MALIQQLYQPELAFLPIRWYDPTTKTNDGGVAASQSVSGHGADLSENG
jgi:hypothetical protein